MGDDVNLTPKGGKAGTGTGPEDWGNTGDAPGVVRCGAVLGRLTTHRRGVLTWLPNRLSSTGPELKLARVGAGYFPSGACDWVRYQPCN
jgi:hypothetical protein